MRAISSRTCVGTLLPPMNCPWALVGWGKIPPYFPPANNRLLAFASIMQSGMVLLGNGCPGTSVAETAAEHPAPSPATPVGTVAILALPPKVAGKMAPVPGPDASGYSLAKGTV